MSTIIGAKEGNDWEKDFDIYPVGTVIVFLPWAHIGMRVMHKVDHGLWRDLQGCEESEESMGTYQAMRIFYGKGVPL